MNNLIVTVDVNHLPARFLHLICNHQIDRFQILVVS